MESGVRFSQNARRRTDSEESPYRRATTLGRYAVRSLAIGEMGQQQAMGSFSAGATGALERKYGSFLVWFWCGVVVVFSTVLHGGELEEDSRPHEDETK